MSYIYDMSVHELVIAKISSLPKVLVSFLELNDGERIEMSKRADFQSIKWIRDSKK